MKFIIKNNRKLITVFIILIYVFILPLCISTLSSQRIDDIQLAVFKYMQQLILLPCMIVLSYMFSSYVENEYKEVISSIDRRYKYRNILQIYGFIQLILIPFYIVINILIRGFIIYTVCFMFQSYILYNIYYFISGITHISFVSLGIMICYMIVYSLVLYDFRLGNIFLVNMSIDMVDISYYIWGIMISLISVILSMLIERKGL